MDLYFPPLLTARPETVQSGVIDGTVTSPLGLHSAWLSLIRQSDLVVLQYRQSGRDGTFRFTALIPGEVHMLVGKDPKRSYSAIIADGLLAEAD